MKRSFLFCFFLLMSSFLFGQMNPVTDQYVLNPLTINPAVAGNRGALNLATFYRRQWAGITGTPETMSLTADAPFFDNNVGAGLIIIYDKVGVSKETQLISNYAYRVELRKGTLSFGMGAGMIMTNTEWSDLVVLDPGDELYMIDSPVFVVPAFSFGTYYSSDHFFSGFSIPKLLSYSFDHSRNKYTMSIDPSQHSYMLHTGFMIRASLKVRFVPSALITYTPDQEVLFDLNTHLNYQERFWIGASYRNGRSIAGFFQFSLNDQFKIAYTYNFDIGRIQAYSNGSHEIMLRYEFRYKVDVVNPLVF